MSMIVVKYSFEMSKPVAVKVSYLTPNYGLAYRFSLPLEETFLVIGIISFLLKCTTNGCNASI